MRQVLYADSKCEVTCQSFRTILTSATGTSLDSHSYFVLGPNSLEGQATRSSEQPRTIELPDNDFDATHMLLRLMHSQQPADSDVLAAHLSRMAIAADKWDCSTTLSLAAEAWLKRKAVEISRNSKLGVLYNLGALASSAFLLRSKEMFALFTRWLVLLETRPFSTMMDDEVFSNLPTSVILGLEEQRSAARDMLVNATTQRTNGRCIVSSCASRAATSSLILMLLVYLKSAHWPPPWPDTPIRALLRRMNSLPDVELGQSLRCNHVNPSSMISVQFHAIAKDASNRAYRMCLQCAMEHKSHGECKHVSATKELVCCDPFIEL